MIPDIDTFLQQNGPSDVEDCFVHSKPFGRRFVLRTSKMIRKKQKFFVHSNFPGTGKHTIVKLILKNLGIEWIIIDENCTLQYLQDMICNRNVSDMFTETETKKKSSFCLLVEENTTKIVFDFLCENRFKIPIVFFRTNAKITKRERLRTLFLKNSPKNKVARHIVRKTLQYKRHISRVAVKKIIALSSNNLRFMMKLWHQTLHCTPKYKTCQLKHVERAYEICHPDSFRTYNLFLDNCFNKHVNISEIQHPIVLTTNLHKKYLFSVETLEHVLMIADALSVIDVTKDQRSNNNLLFTTFSRYKSYISDSPCS
jgi:hypothetical protein